MATNTSIKAKIDALEEQRAQLQSKMIDKGVKNLAMGGNQSTR